MRIVFGTLELPGGEPGARLLDRYVAAGGSALDVANVYQDGDAARSVGRWLARGTRPRPALYAKGCHPPHCRPDLVAAEVDRARTLLESDRLDVFILHRDDPAFPVAAWADALLAEVGPGRIGAFGVSNWTVARARELREHLESVGADGLCAFSNHFSLARMVSAPWDGCLAVSADDVGAVGELGMTVLAWSSLARGFFAGHDSPHWDSPDNRARRDRARELAARRGCSPSTVALAYVLHQPHMRAVVGTRSESHLDEALAAATLELSPAELMWLEDACPASPPPVA